MNTKRQYRINNKKSKNISKRNSKNINKLIKGGTHYNDNFLEKYDKNLEKVNEAIEKYSGKHKIQKKQANKFIENQLTDARRQAARDLVENSIYITLEEVSQAVEHLIKKAYAKFSPDADIYLYTGPKEKSFYFLSTLALFYIRKNGLKEPKKFISNFTVELFDEIGNSPIILIDDVAYSGSQLSTMMNNIYYVFVVKNSKPPPNIFILLVALNTFSKNRLSLVPKKKDRRDTIVLEWTQSPFQLIYSKKRLYEPLVIKLGIQRYFNINVLFSPYTKDTPYVALYLDYKVADEASTYKNVLFYGPIVPEDYDYKKYITDMNYLDYQYEFYTSKEYFDEGEYNKIFQDFNKEFGTSFTSYNINLTKQLLYNLIESDKFSSSKFYPLVSTCNETEELIAILEDENVQNFDYRLFVAPQGCIEGNLDCVASGPIDQDYFKNIMKEKSLSKTEVVRISDKIYGYNCPLTWYKKGDLKLE